MDTKDTKKAGTRRRAAPEQPVRNTGKTGRTPPARRTAADGAVRRKKAPAERGADAQAEKTAAARRRRPAKRPASKPAAPKRPKRPTPDVVYTPPKPFSRNRLLLRLATIAAVVLALTFGISVFFKVQTVTVSGTEKYTAWQVMEASGIRQGDHLLTLWKPRVGGKIRVALPYVDDVRIVIELPGTVHISIKELDVVYSAQDTAGNWWLMTAGGRVVEQADSAKAGEHTKLTGFALDKPEAGKQAAAYQEPAGTDEAGETVPVTVLSGDRLSAALSIAQYLEQNGILGEAASLDVSDLSNIRLWYGQKFQVMLGDTTQLSYKISSMKAAINDPRMEHESGILDVSFRIMKDQVMYTPFGADA